MAAAVTLADQPYTVVARYRESQWVGADGSLHSRQSLCPFSRLSHPRALDDLRECLKEGEFPQLLPNMQDGRRYTLICEIRGRDYETGQPDDWGWVVSGPYEGAEQK